MKTFAQFLSEAPFVPKAPSSETAFGIVGGNLLSSPTTNTINIPQSKASSGSMGFDIDSVTANRLNNELTSSGRNPENYNSSYSAATDLRSDNNNQENQSVQFRMLQSMFDQLPPNSGMNGTLATDMANTLSVNGFKVDEVYEAMIKMYQEYAKGQGLNINTYQAVNNLIMAKQQTDKGSKPQNIPNVNTFDPLADLKKYKLFAPVEPENADEQDFDDGFVGTDAIYGS